MTGRVGIGTTTPTSLLTLYGAYSNLMIRASTGGSEAVWLSTASRADQYIWGLGQFYHCGTLSLNCGDLNVCIFTTAAKLESEH